MANLADDEVETLMIDVRASTQGFAQDVQVMRGTFDTTVLDGFKRAGSVLEGGLVSAIRRGSLGFDDLKRIALSTINEIAAQAVRGLFRGSAGGGGLGGLIDFEGVLGSILGLPGRATGGIVAPGRGYLVGERGPELFVPTSAGRVEANPGASRPRDVRVAISVAGPAGASAPQSLQRSSRQVASAVRRALTAN